LTNPRTGKPVGETADAGYQIGVRRTVSATIEQAWVLLTSREGVALWIGPMAAPLPIEPGIEFRADNGVEGKLRIVKPPVQLRLAWRRPAWPAASTLQIRVLPAARPERCAISFHQEKLANGSQREEMKQHWEAVMDSLETRLTRG
jgi:uncharacterized protein YndB with AHSA1/START domain